VALYKYYITITVLLIFNQSFSVVRYECESGAIYAGMF